MDRYLLSPPAAALHPQVSRRQHCTCATCPPPPAYNPQWLSSQANPPPPPSYTQASQQHHAAARPTPSEREEEDAPPTGLSDATKVVDQPRPPGFLTRCLQKIADATTFDEDKTPPRSSVPQAVLLVRVQENNNTKQSKSDMCFGSCCRN
ncbi:hypothetical protein JDV02_010257 [Purpureocillium takamizusanense]|uniref:Uncharacterized protein n=1 Tax=Purpureocillium takamizusanense TaxID=2060973 RepID=A0A9Q8QNL4_9HYPO|nr:uncharacterized protein JDV02_010257 [Purpureocillium takamizusanense]UNI24519.1 hypothetical protein JDV02_010257 [Purpureocillium takamizusanense]